MCGWVGVGVESKDRGNVVIIVFHKSVNSMCVVAVNFLKFNESVPSVAVCVCVSEQNVCLPSPVSRW